MTVQEGNIMSSRIKKSRRGRVAAGVLALALATTGALLVPAAAQADGTNVVWSHGSGGTTALRVIGSGINVQSVRVSHGDGGTFVNYCGFQSKVWGKLKGGFSTSWTFGYTAGCTPAPYWNDRGISSNMQSGSNLYGQSYHNGVWAPGIPAIGIWA